MALITIPVAIQVFAILITITVAIQVFVEISHLLMALQFHHCKVINFLVFYYYAVLES